MEDHHENDDNRNENFLCQRSVQRSQCFVDDAGSIVKRNHSNLARCDPTGPLLAWRVAEVIHPGRVVGVRHGDWFQRIGTCICVDLLGSRCRVVDHDLRGQTRRQFDDLLLDVFNGLQWVEAVPDHADSTHCFGARLIQGTTPECRPESDGGYVSDCDGDVVLDFDHRLFDVLHLLDEAESADDVFHFVQLDCARADIDVGHAD